MVDTISETHESGCWRTAEQRRWSSCEGWSLNCDVARCGSQDLTAEGVVWSEDGWHCRLLTDLDVFETWAVLLARIYDVLPLLCPACGGEMRILAFLTDPPVVSAILLHLDLPHTPPPLSPARGPPQSDLLIGLLDQTPAFDPAEPDPIPDFEVDQSGPDFDFDQSLPDSLDD